MSRARLLRSIPALDRLIAWLSASAWNRNSPSETTTTGKAHTLLLNPITTAAMLGSRTSTPRSTTDPKIVPASIVRADSGNRNSFEIS